MHSYLLIQPDEDGNVTRFLTEEELQEILENPLEWGGIEEFIDSEHPNAYTDPQYWGEGQAMLLEVNIIKPRPVTSKWILD